MMTIADVINFFFEFFAGIAIYLHCREAEKAKSVQGVSFLATMFFTVWGVWNLIYYPILGQWASVIAAIFVFAGNVYWINIQYRYNPKVRRLIENIQFTNIFKNYKL